MTFQGKLVVSCQADPGDAFFGFMDRYALAAQAGGAAGIRANGVDDIRAIRKVVNLPIIGIQKELYADGKVLITPSFEAARALVGAGADMVAIDFTTRGQQYGALERLQRIKTELQVPVLADIATLEEAQEAERAGADFVLSTMRGYTADTLNVERFDPSFIEQLVRLLRVPVIAEGRIDSPDLARQAIEAGAYSVIVGTTITRPHSVARLLPMPLRLPSPTSRQAAGLSELTWVEPIPSSDWSQVKGSYCGRTHAPHPRVVAVPDCFNIWKT